MSAGQSRFLLCGVAQTLVLIQYDGSPSTVKPAAILKPGSPARSRAMSQAYAAVTAVLLLSLATVATESEQQKTPEHICLVTADFWG